MAEPVFIESKTEMEDLLRQELWGNLGVCTADGQPYVVPMNHAYVGGKLLFHCALDGKKLDCIRANPTVCYTVARQEGTVQDHAGSLCHINNDSVICLGEARIVEDLKERGDLLSRFNRRFRPEAKDVAPERVAGCAVIGDHDPGDDGPPREGPEAHPVAVRAGGTEGLSARRGLLHRDGIPPVLKADAPARAPGMMSRMFGFRSVGLFITLRLASRICIQLASVP